MQYLHKRKSFFGGAQENIYGAKKFNFSEKIMEITEKS